VIDSILVCLQSPPNQMKRHFGEYSSEWIVCQEYTVGEKINSDRGVEFELMELSTDPKNLPTDPETGEFIR
jgi:hypothetical protein